MIGEDLVLVEELAIDMNFQVFLQKHKNKRRPLVATLRLLTLRVMSV